MADTTAAPAGLTVKNVTVALDGTTIVDDVSMRVDAGEFVGIVGPNGSGKSTFLKSVYKAVRPTSGEVWLDDLNVTARRPAIVAREMAVIAQFQEMSFDLTVSEMVGLGRAPHQRLLEPRHGEDARIVERVLRTVGLDRMAGQSVQTLSGGEKQRVALARALAQQPRFLVLDEPTNHLDVRHQFDVLDTVAALGTGVLAALHDLHLAARYCTTVYVLRHGRVAAAGPPDDVLTAQLVKDVYEVACDTYRDPHGHLAFAYRGAWH